MKTMMVRLVVLGCVMPVLTLLTSFLPASAGDAPGVPAQTFKGTATMVNEKERAVAVKELWGTRTFYLGEHCAVIMEDKPEATLKDLHPGHQLNVQYSMHSGVRVASRIEQKHPQFAGHITAVDAANQTFTAGKGRQRMTFTANSASRIIGGDDKSKAFTDLAIGHKVNVHYSTEAQLNIGHKIELLGLIFSGTVAAIDADARTLRAKHLLSDRTFKLAKDCQVVIDGKPDGKLSDLRLGDRLSFQYDDVDGVFVACRAAREGVSRTSSGQTVENQ
jgi:hypothetical protein